MTSLVDLDFSVEEDDLIQEMLDAKGKQVEVIAFGVFYAGILSYVDAENGTIEIADGDDRAVMEVERVTSFSILIP